MRVCDACYLGAGKEIIMVVEAKHKKPSEGSYGSVQIWPPSKEESPEFCAECFALFQAKNWSDLGKRHDQSLEKLLQQVKPRRRATDTATKSTGGT